MYYEGNSSEGKVSMSKQSSVRNEKNGIYCSHCFKPEPPYCSISCVGNCKRHFHEECALKIGATKSVIEGGALNWQCPDCRK